MTIVFVARIALDEHCGGSIVYFTELAKYFKMMGCNVHILVGTDDANKQGVSNVGGVSTHKVFLKYNNSLLNYIYRNRAYAKVLKEINDQSRIDILNIQEAGFLIFVKRDQCLCKIPVVYTFHAPVHYEVLYDYRKMRKEWNLIRRILKYIKMKAQYIKFKLAEESDLKYSKRVIVMSHFV